MDDLLSKASRAGLDSDVAELAIGGYLHVLKESESFKEDRALEAILDYLGKDAEINLRQYEKLAQPKKPVKKMVTNFLKLKPNHPPELLKKVDGKNTQDVVQFLDKNYEGCDPEKLLKFMKVFISYLQDNVAQAVDIDEILHMPAKPKRALSPKR